jgi:hypothetical protein
MLTESQRLIFTQMVDINWEAVNQKDFKKKFALYEKLAELQIQLEKSMGKEAYDAFMRKGKQMFTAAD